MYKTWRGSVAIKAKKRGWGVDNKPNHVHPYMRSLNITVCLGWVWYEGGWIFPGLNGSLVGITREPVGWFLLYHSHTHNVWFEGQNSVLCNKEYHLKQHIMYCTYLTNHSLKTLCIMHCNILYTYIHVPLVFYVLQSVIHSIIHLSYIHR